MSFSDYYVTQRTRQGNFLHQIDELIYWHPIEPGYQATLCTGTRCITGRPVYPGLLLFKMLLVGIWHGGLSDEAVEDMANYTADYAILGLNTGSNF